MSTFIITNKATGAEVTRYSAAAPVESVNGQAYPFADFGHTDFESITPRSPHQ